MKTHLTLTFFKLLQFFGLKLKFWAVTKLDLNLTARVLQLTVKLSLTTNYGLRPNYSRAIFL